MLMLLSLVFLVGNNIEMSVQAQQVILPEDSVWGLSWSPDSSQIATGHFDGTIQIRDSQTGDVVKTFQVNPISKILQVAWSPNGSRLAGSTADGFIYLWNMNDDQLSYRLETNAPISGLAWSPDSTQIAGINDISHHLQIWDADSGESLINQRTSGIAIDWFEEKLVIAGMGGFSQIEAVTGEHLKIVPSGYPISVAWGPTGDRIALGDVNAEIQIWDSALEIPHDVKQPLHTLSEHTLPVTSVDWHPNGIYLASASLDGTICIWDVDNEKLLEKIDTGAPLLRLQWNTEGDRLAYAGGDTAGIGAAVKIIELSSLVNVTAFP